MNGENFISLYERERKKIDEKLIKIFKDRKPQSLYEPAAYILKEGGKRLRPLLVLFSSKAVGGKFSQVYNASLAVELLHNFTLVHDDIMDNADKRRGRLTLHKKYDLNVAILAGDGLLSIAYEYLLKDCNGNTKDVLAAFTKGLVEVCEGQSLDKNYEVKKNVSIDEYLLMIRKKTAAMIEMCCLIGAVLGGGSKNEIKAFSHFGKNIGIAFQIQDDLLDIIAEEKKFGKQVGGDLIEGKKTYLFIKALEKADGINRKKLLKVIENKGINKEQVSEYKNIYEELGILNDAKEEIINYTKQAVNSLKAVRNKNDKKLFLWLADFLINRIK